MALFIVRVSETADRTIRKRLPGYYGDGQKAWQALEKFLVTYEKHGRNDEHGYSWARDDEGNLFKFFVEGSP